METRYKCATCGTAIDFNGKWTRPKAGVDNYVILICHNEACADYSLLRRYYIEGAEDAE